jgi:hypothetical protein
MARIQTLESPPMHHQATREYRPPSLKASSTSSSSSLLLIECVSVSVAVVVPSRDAAASVEVFWFIFINGEKKLVIMVLFMKLVVSIGKDMNERQDSKVDDGDGGDGMEVMSCVVFSERIASLAHYFYLRCPLGHGTTTYCL